MKINKNNYKINILRPAGNDTALFEGLQNKANRKAINDAVMQAFPNVEQVGFYQYVAKTREAVLEMAGGEFCGNATRSLAYLLLKGKPGELQINVSGTDKALQAGVRKDNTAYAAMPIILDFSSVRKLSDDLFRVELEGITQLVIKWDEDLSPIEYKKLARKMLKENNLLYSVSAAGVIFASENKRVLSIKPVVWVRDIKTLFFETACASGTTAVGLVRAMQTNRAKVTLQIQQPSSQFIQITIMKNKEKFISAVIDGPISVVKENL